MGWTSSFRGDERLRAQVARDGRSYPRKIRTKGRERVSGLVFPRSGPFVEVLAAGLFAAVILSLGSLVRSVSPNGSQRLIRQASLQLTRLLPSPPSPNTLPILLVLSRHHQHQSTSSAPCPTPYIPKGRPRNPIGRAVGESGSKHPRHRDSYLAARSSRVS